LKVVASYNIKGGVGKTSAAVNLASLAAADGYRVLLWDLDPQGSASFLFRIKAKVKGGGDRLVRGESDVDALIKGTDHEHLDLLPADFSYRHMDLALDEQSKPTRRLRRVLREVEDQYDLVFLDCPPSISLVSENVFEASDILLVPLIPTTLSLQSFRRLTAFLATGVDRPPAVLAFFSMVDRRKKLHREIIEAFPRRNGSVATTVIPASADVENMGVHRDVVASYAPRGAAARAYEALWTEVKHRLSHRRTLGK
jgi:cellulose biosynthesis protein BcsQ